jgi:transcriptional regulator with XRE-family HTH domain
MKRSEGENLRAMREHEGYSQKELGELAGISPKTIGGYENGKRNLGRINGPRLAKAFGLPLNDFWFLIRSEGGREMIQTWMMVSKMDDPQDKQRVLRAVRKLVSTRVDERSVFELMLQNIETLGNKPE